MSNTQALDIHAGNQLAHPQAGDRPAYWSGIFAMTLCAFALVASEFMPVSLLTPVAADLQISEGLAGQAISVSGVFAVLTSLFISALAGKASRKTLLLAMTGLMFLSTPIIALAPNYATYMAGRVLLGVAIGGFWSMSAASAMRLVPAAKVPRALAIFNGGNALATVVAAPLGSYLGSIIGWRGAFFCLAPIALLAFVWQWISLPPMKTGEPRAGSGNVFKLLKNPVVALGMAAVSVFFMGQFALFTYMRPFLETVTGVDVPTLSLILLIMGVGGFVGTVLIGAFLKRSFYGTLLAIPLLMALIAVSLIAFGSSVSIAMALLGVWGLVATAAPVGWWSWLARTLPENAEAGGGLMVAVVQLAIGLGSTVGGLLFDKSGYKSTFVMSAALLLVSALLAFLTSRAERARSQPVSVASSSAFGENDRVAWVRGLNVDEQLTVVAAAPGSVLAPGDKIEEIDGRSSRAAVKMSTMLSDKCDAGVPFTIKTASAKVAQVVPSEVCRGYTRLAAAQSSRMQDYHWLMSVHPLETVRETPTEDEALWMVLWTQGVSEEGGMRMKTYHYGTKVAGTIYTVATLVSGVKGVAMAAETAIKSAQSAAASVASDILRERLLEQASAIARNQVRDQLGVIVKQFSQQQAMTAMEMAAANRGALGGVAWIAGTVFDKADAWAMERMIALNADPLAPFTLHQKLIEQALPSNAFLFDAERLAALSKLAEARGRGEDVVAILKGIRPDSLQLNLADMPLASSSQSLGIFGGDAEAAARPQIFGYVDTLLEMPLESASIK